MRFPLGSCNLQEHTFSRRLFLQGLAGSALGGFGQLFSAANAQEAARRQKHVILVYMSGGPSQFETWPRSFWARGCEPATRRNDSTA